MTMEVRTPDAATEEALLQNFCDAPTKVDVDNTSGGTEILAASAASGRYRVIATGDVYIRQVNPSTTITAATASWLPAGVIDYVDYKNGSRLVGITDGGTVTVEAMRCLAPIS